MFSSFLQNSLPHRRRCPITTISLSLLSKGQMNERGHSFGYLHEQPSFAPIFSSATNIWHVDHCPDECREHGAARSWANVLRPRPTRSTWQSTARRSTAGRTGVAGPPLTALRRGRAWKFPPSSRRAKMKRHFRRRQALLGRRTGVQVECARVGDELRRANFPNTAPDARHHAARDGPQGTSWYGWCTGTGLGLRRRGRSTTWSSGGSSARSCGGSPSFTPLRLGLDQAAREIYPEDPLWAVMGEVANNKTTDIAAQERDLEDDELTGGPVVFD